MGKLKRIFMIAVDSFGAGDGRGARAYGDEGTGTMGCIAESVNHWEISNLQKLGTANMHPLKGVAPVEKPMGHYTVMNESSCGKDTMIRHWELMGIKTARPFVTFTETGFPKELVEGLEKRTGHKVIGNKSSSGTTILDEPAEEEITTGHMIVYISTDSVLQICGSEEAFGLDGLYRCCEIARELTMKGEWCVGHVIARSYVGKKKGEFKCTSDRHGYAPKPAGKTALDVLKEHGFEVISVGKTRDTFDGEGITKAYKFKSSVHDMEQAIDIIKDEDFEGLCFANLVDFDVLWGHRRNPQGYAEGVEMLDVKLGEASAGLWEDDLSMITADHGNDPTYSGTGHTREQVPLLVYSKQFEGGEAFKETDTFATVGAIIVENFGVKMPEGIIGSSILGRLF